MMSKFITYLKMIFGAIFVQSDIDSIVYWVDVWQLKISLIKTVMLHMISQF